MTKTKKDSAKAVERLQTERLAVDTLLQRGIIFRAGLLRFKISQSYLGTLLHISREYLKISIDEEQIENEAYRGSFMLVPENARRVAKIVALAVLNNRIKIALFAGILSKYLLWKLTPEKLFGVMGMILVLNNTASFTNSIRLIHTFRIMQPKDELIEGVH